MSPSDEGKPKVQCQFCPNGTWLHPGGMARHIRAKHPDQVKKSQGLRVVCQKCARELSKSGLRRHYLKVHKCPPPRKNNPERQAHTRLIQTMMKYGEETLRRKRMAEAAIDQYLGDYRNSNRRRKRFSSAREVKGTPRAIDDLQVLKAWIEASLDTVFLTADEYMTIVSDTTIDAEDMLLRDPTFSHSVIYINL